MPSTENLKIRYRIKITIPEMTEQPKRYAFKVLPSKLFVSGKKNSMLKNKHSRRILAQLLRHTGMGAPNDSGSQPCDHCHGRNPAELFGMFRQYQYQKPVNWMVNYSVYGGYLTNYVSQVNLRDYPNRAGA